LDANDERGPAVQAARCFSRVVVLWRFFATAPHLEAIGCDAMGYQVISDACGDALAERERLLSRSDVAGMSFDDDAARGCSEPAAVLMLSRAFR
jgi:hypothetical protein